MTLIALLTALHGLAAVVWVGGMFFAHMALRPALPLVLDPPQPLKLWQQVFPRFFAWVWVSVITLLGTGYWLMFGVYGGFAGSPAFIHLMQGTGLLMAVNYVVLYFVPYRRFRQSAVAGEWAEAARHQARIRHIVFANLILGLITVAVGASGRFW